ncbi:MAG: hypothetical protein PHV18_10590 [Lachnospiraceae bacterium]|nr:hypothetical protein [Lachnospiraceae bacterium]
MEQYRLVTYSITCFFMMLCAVIFIKRRMGSCGTALLAAGAFFANIMRNCVTEVYPYGSVKYGLMLFGVLVSFLAEFILAEYRDSRAIATMMMAGCYSMFGDGIAKLLYARNTNLVTAVVIEVTVHTVLLVLLVIFLLPAYRRIQKVYREEWRWFNVILALYFICECLLYIGFPDPRGVFTQGMLRMGRLLTTYLMMTLAFRMFDRLDRDETELQEREVLHASMEALRHDVDEIRKAEQKIAVYNHDGRHFVRMIGGMMSEGDYEGAAQALALAEEPIEEERI